MQCVCNLSVMYIRYILSGNCGRTSNLVRQVCDAVIVYATCWWELLYPAVCVFVQRVAV